MPDREFANTFPDYNGEKLLNAQGQISDDLQKRLQTQIDRQLHRLYEGLDSVDQSDYSIYTGSTGIALLHFHLSHIFDHDENPRYLKRAITYIERPLRHLKRKKVTFLCGDAGPLAVGAVLYHRLGQQEKCEDCLNRLFALHKDVCSDPALPDEFLFGRVGYLFALLFVQRHLGEECVNPDLISVVFHTIISSGKKLAERERSECPLMYEWHEKGYLGAAHGLVGIFYTLLLVKDPAYKNLLRDLVKPSIDWLMSLRYPSGNYPSSIGSASDKLVHWCHGAPGWVHMLVQAYKTFDDKKYLEAARGCAEVVWARGLLRKGYGICHGVAGNAYTFLTVYRLTGEEKYLHRACKFAEWCFDYGKHGCRTPDRPMSLFEGLAGTVYFLSDLLDPANAKFPAFEL
ncbi:LanC-like protein 2 [Lamellibrachia satsuma]|nr:LanC-like protein 2 [Lamellibrachia satsuma]